MVTIAFGTTMNLLEALISIISIGQLVGVFLTLFLFQQSINNHTWQRIQAFTSTILLLKQWQDMTEDLRFFCRHFPVEIKEHSIELDKISLFQLSSSRIKFYSPSQDPIWLSGASRLEKLKLEHCVRGSFILVVTKTRTDLLKVEECNGHYMPISNTLLETFKLPSVVIPIKAQEYKWVKKNNSYQVFVKRNGVYQVFTSGFDSIFLELLNPCELHFKIKLEYFSGLDWHDSLC
jgi:hypothetical protein